MIAKISRGSNARGLAMYLHGPGRANEHVWRDERTGRQYLGGRVIGGTVAGSDRTSGRSWAREFEQAGRANQRVGKTVWHCSLRSAPGDRRLSDAEWAVAGQMLAEGLGYGSHPWVVVRHADDHVHIAVSRVNHLGGVWKGSHDRHRVRPVVREIERVFGLAAVADESQPEAVLKAGLTQGEHRRAQREGRIPPRTELAASVRMARDVASGRGRGAFEAELDRLGVAWRANEASTGRMNGYSFATSAVDGRGEVVWLSASRVDRGLSWSRLSAVLAEGPRSYWPAPESRVPRKRLESKRAHGARADQAGLADYRARRGRGLAEELRWQARYWAGIGELDPGLVTAREMQERWQAVREQMVRTMGQDPEKPILRAPERGRGVPARGRRGVQDRGNDPDLGL